MNLTISYLNVIYLENGTRLNNCSDINLLKTLAEGKEKKYLPALYPYTGTKGEYNNSNTFFIDIDTTENVEELLSRSDEVFSEIPYIVYMQKSASQKLHLICTFPEQGSAAEWSYNAALYTVSALHILKNKFNWDFFEETDKHCLKFTQGFYMTSYDIIENPFGGSYVKFSKNDIKHLTETYKSWFEESKPNKDLAPVEIDPTQLVNYDYFNTDVKLTIDKTFKVAGYSGNELRWRIGRELYYLLGSEDAALAFCEEHFTNHKEIKIYTKYPENRIVKNWLLTTFHKTVIDNTPKTLVKDYLTEYYDDIKDLYNQNKRILIKAPTGTGKSVLTKRLANEYNAVVIVPFNTMLELYTKDEPELGLQGLLEVSSSSLNAYTTERPVVMVWDQAMKYDLTDRLVISDETHQWFNDRTFRQSAVKTLDAAKHWKKLICISATPSGEQFTLQLPVFEFYKERKNIKTVICHADQPGEYIQEVLKTYKLSKTTTKYSRVCIFTDMYAKRLYENNPDSVLIHSCMKGSKEFVELLKNELIPWDITILTSLAFNGLNFLNSENETILVIVDCEEGKDTANKIIQAAGRFRKANVELLVMFKNKKSDKEKQTLSEKKDDAMIIEEYIEDTNDKFLSVDSRLLFDDSYNALTEIEIYTKNHATQDMIIKELCEAQYFTPISHKYTNQKLEKIELVKKKEDNKQFIDMILNNEKIDEQELTDYQKGWNNAIKRISERTNIDWATVVGTYKKGVLMDSIIDEINFIVKVCELSEEEFLRVTSNEKIERLLSMGLSKVCLAKQVSYIKKMKAIRSQWELFDQTDENDLEAFLQLFVGDRINAKKELKRKQIESGKSNAQKISIVNIETNEVVNFDSKMDCMKFLNISNNSFNKFLKGETVKKCSNWKIN